MLAAASTEAVASTEAAASTDASATGPAAKKQRLDKPASNDNVGARAYVVPIVDPNMQALLQRVQAALLALPRHDKPWTSRSSAASKEAAPDRTQPFWAPMQFHGNKTARLVMTLGADYKFSGTMTPGFDITSIDGLEEVCNLLKYGGDGAAEPGNEVVRIHANLYPGQHLEKHSATAATCGKLSWHSDARDGQDDALVRIVAVSLGSPMIIMVRKRKDAPAHTKFKDVDIVTFTKYDKVLGYAPHMYVMEGPLMQTVTEHTVVPLHTQERRVKRWCLANRKQVRVPQQAQHGIRISLTFRFAPIVIKK
jgi:hypothetical protein